VQYPPHHVVTYHVLIAELHDCLLLPADHHRAQPPILRRPPVVQLSRIVRRRGLEVRVLTLVLPPAEATLLACGPATRALPVALPEIAHHLGIVAVRGLLRVERLQSCLHCH
jgi:hypothetical protein